MEIPYPYGLWIESLGPVFLNGLQKSPQSGPDRTVASLAAPPLYSPYLVTLPSCLALFGILTIVVIGPWIEFLLAG